MAESSFLIRSCRVGVVNSDHQMIVSADIRGNMDASKIEKTGRYGDRPFLHRMDKICWLRMAKYQDFKGSPVCVDRSFAVRFVSAGLISTIEPVFNPVLAALFG